MLVSISGQKGRGIEESKKIFRKRGMLTTETVVIYCVSKN